ncbi:hypothetical protein [Spiroplasma endosymbiont of Crioceris asparagi]|uniref:ribosome maturation factor RimM n=1 Tax=Spiroplasma endosymbiont of Crioceris asparagi TaxID=3066286 RepID=UPI0030D3ADB6
MNKLDLVSIGFFKGTHGIKGGLVFVIDEQYINVIENNFVLFVKNENKFDYYIVERTYQKGIKFIVVLKDNDSIGKVQNLINKEVFIKANQVIKSQFINYIGYKIHDETKSEIGYVDDFIKNSAYITLRANLDSRVLWIPCVDEFVSSIDDKNKIINVKDIKGLI